MSLMPFRNGVTVFLRRLAAAPIRPFLHAFAVTLCVFLPPFFLRRLARAGQFPFGGAFMFRAALAPAMFISLPLFFMLKSLTSPLFVQGALEATILRDLQGPQVNIGRLAHVLSHVPAFHIDDAGLQPLPGGSKSVTVNDPYSGMAAALFDPARTTRMEGKDLPFAAVMFLRDGLQFRSGDAPPMTMSYEELRRTLIPETALLAAFTDGDVPLGGMSAVELLNALGQWAGRIPPFGHARGEFTLAAPAAGAQPYGAGPYATGATVSNGPLIVLNVDPAAPPPAASERGLIYLTRYAVYVRRREGAEFAEIFNPETDRDAVLYGAGAVMQWLQNLIKILYWPIVLPLLTLSFYLILYTWYGLLRAVVAACRFRPREAGDGDTEAAGAVCAFFATIWFAAVVFPFAGEAVRYLPYIAVAFGAGYYVCWVRRVRLPQTDLFSTSAPA